MNSGKSFNDIYLNLQFRKSAEQASRGIGKTDEYGNYLFEVEASNENLDLQNQIVLQNALLESKDNFLKYGVISNDHLHHKKGKRGEQITDESQIIGEPVSVRTDGNSTIVVGKLYRSNPEAQKIINLLKDGSTRVRASVGGIFPEVEPDSLSGGEKVTRILWNDLALTVTPVNNTVSHAELVKSLEPKDFVKALCAGSGTDHSSFTGGRALIPENVKDKVLETNNEIAGFGGHSNEFDPDKENIRALIVQLQNGKINGKAEAEKYLKDNGFNLEQSRQIVREIIEQGGVLMKSSFSDKIKELMKSLSKSDEDKDEDLLKSEENDEGEENDKAGVNLDDEDTINLDDDSDEDEEDDIDSDDEGADNEDEKKVGKGKSCKKSMSADDDGDVVDATLILKSLGDDLGNLHKSVSDIGNAVVALGEMVAKVSGEKLPVRAQYYVNKSLGTPGGKGTENTVPNSRPTQADFELVQNVLEKSVEKGEITLEKSTIMSSEFQRQMKGVGKMNPSTYKFLAERINGGK